MESLVEIAKKYPLTDKYDTHCYVDQYYEEAMAPLRREPVALVEIGIASGHSLLMWREYFSKGIICGIDTEIIQYTEQILATTRVVTLQMDAYTARAADYFSSIDIFIDDGPHSPASQLAAISLYLPKVPPTGLFIIEDVQSPEILEELYQAVPADLRPRTRKLDLRRHRGRRDDLMLVVEGTSYEV